MTFRHLSSCVCHACDATGTPGVQIGTPEGAGGLVLCQICSVLAADAACDPSMSIDRRLVRIDRRLVRKD